MGRGSSAAQRAAASEACKNISLERLQAQYHRPLSEGQSRDAESRSQQQKTHPVITFVHHFSHGYRGGERDRPLVVSFVARVRRVECNDRSPLPRAVAVIKPVPFIHPPPIARPRPCVILLSKTKVGCSPIQHNGLFPLSTSLRTTALLLKITLVRCVLVRLEVARNAQRHFPDFDMCPVQIRPVVRNAGDESRPSSALSSTACINHAPLVFFFATFFYFLLFARPQPTADTPRVEGASSTRTSLRLPPSGAVLSCNLACTVATACAATHVVARTS